MGQSIEAEGASAAAGLIWTKASHALKHELGLQDRFTFDTFVVGPSNEFAYAVARRVASWADGHFNPVVFHGPTASARPTCSTPSPGKPCARRRRRRWST
jgi:chromosomal replication initiation ATPase DnaA